MANPKILLFSGSIRSNSLNQKLVDIVAKLVDSEGGSSKVISLSDFPLPIYNGDFELEKGLPENSPKLHKLFSEHQGIFIACPEYNGGYTPLLKNVIDWVSRIRADGAASAFRNRIFALGAAAPGKFGGIRGLLGIRPVLEVALGATVLPEQIALSNAGEEFDAEGNLTGDVTKKQIGRLAANLVVESKRFVSI